MGVLLAIALSATAAAPDAPPAASALAPRPTQVRLLAMDFGAGAAAAVVSVPLSMALAAWVGTWSNQLLIALPSLLLFAAIPPLAVTLAEVWWSNRLSPGSARVRPALYIGFAAQVAMMVVGILSGVWVADFVAATLFTLAEAVVLPGVVTGVFWFQGVGLPPPAPSVLPNPSLPPPAPSARLSFAF